MKKLTGIVLVGLAFGMLGPAVPEAHADECGMGPDIDWYSAERAKVAQADVLLDTGHEREAGWVVQTLWPRLREARPVESSLPHIAEGVRVMALAAVRTNGNVRRGPGWTSATPDERAANVRWGVERLRMLVAAHPESPLARTDLAEAIARSPASQTEASALLEALEAAHSIATPEGFHAHARRGGRPRRIRGGARQVRRHDGGAGSLRR